MRLPRLNTKILSAFVSIVILVLAAMKVIPSHDIDDVRPALFLVTRVVDGDTVELENGEKVRYIGVNAPESVDPRRRIECFGKEASAKNQELVEGKMVRLEKDISETDKYGRLLRFVFVGDIFVNEYLVRQGFARASSYPPDVRYQDVFHDAEQEARQERRGLWAPSTCGSE